MRGLPLDIGTIHFVGIGGIGMSSIAEILHNLGYHVQGSDVADGYNVKRLRELGVAVVIGHKAENIIGASVVVISSAVKPDNPEVSAARSKFIPVVRRAEMLAELMRLKWSIAVGGTHGKTTTSLIATVLEKTGYDPTVINGGIVNAWGTNARLGASEWLVAEADESDGSFLKLPATIAVITNMDPEHLDHYGSVEKMNDAYVTFLENLPFYGFAALCLDHPVVQKTIARVTDRRIVTYGFSPQADVRGMNLRIGPGGSRFDVVLTNRQTGTGRTIANVVLPMLGQHNVRNALAAITVAGEMGIDDNKVRDALADFAGVKRRFTKTGEAGGITVIDDYGHHPVEIEAVLDAARAACQGKVIAVVQPHRYSRLANLFEEFCACFNKADAVLVADVYAAGEAPIEGADRDSMVQGLISHGHRNVLPLRSPEDLPAMVFDMAGPGDMVVCLGAGSITYWAHELPTQLQKLIDVSGGRQHGRAHDGCAFLGALD